MNNSSREGARVPKVQRKPHEKISRLGAWWAAEKLIWARIGADWLEWWQARVTKLWLLLFVWSGGKLFAFADIYVPGGEGGDVKAMIFAVDETAFLDSCRSTLEEQGD